MQISLSYLSFLLKVFYINHLIFLFNFSKYFLNLRIVVKCKNKGYWPLAVELKWFNSQ